VRTIFNTSVWLQAGQHLALAAQIPAKQKSGCRPLRYAIRETTRAVSRELLAGWRLVRQRQRQAVLACANANASANATEVITITITKQ
jgi:hypothetical protein